MTNYPNKKVTWKYIDRESELHSVGSGSHVAVTIFEFPASGWQNPYEKQGPGSVLGRSPVAKVPRSEFESPCRVQHSGSSLQSCWRETAVKLSGAGPTGAGGHA